MEVNFYWVGQKVPLGFSVSFYEQNFWLIQYLDWEKGSDINTTNITKSIKKQNILNNSLQPNPTPHPQKHFFLDAYLFLINFYKLRVVEHLLERDEKDKSFFQLDGLKFKKTNSL